MSMFRVISMGLLLTLLHDVGVEASSQERNNGKDRLLEEESVIWGREVRKLNLMSMAPSPPPIGKSKLSVSRRIVFYFVIVRNVYPGSYLCSTLAG